MKYKTEKFWASNGNPQNNLYLEDRNLYGSSMLGQDMIGEVIASTDVGEININTEKQSVIGDKRYYGNNHLGNNPVTFTDRKFPESDGQGEIDYSLANITYFAEYYPYGMILRDGGDIATYTFQGQEVDNDAGVEIETFQGVMEIPFLDYTITP